MDERLEIKHAVPAIRQMLADYRIMFSGINLKFLLWGAAAVLILLGLYFVTPYGITLDENASIIVRVIAFFDTYFLFGFGCLLVLSILSPFLAQFLLPFVISLLEVPKLLLLFAQFLIDRVLIEPLVGSYLYPKRDDELK